MSESNYDRRHEAMAPPKRPYKNNRGKKFKKTKDNYFRGRNFNTPYHYFNAKYKFESRWACFRWRRPPLRNTPENEASRPASPFSGTEEYTLKKIQETSDMIKKRLMMPPDAEESVATAEPAPVGNEPAVTVSEVGDDGSGKSDCDRSTMRSGKKVAQYNVEEIHEKIIKHITNLSHGKKVNLICGTSSGYDVAIQQIQKQKRLELSKVLRDMCSNHAAEDGEDIDDIIPDIGIKIKDLPLEVIQQLSSTLDLNFDDTFFSQSSDTTVNVKSEVSDLIFDRPAPEEVTIKNEIVCDETDYAMDDLDFGFPQNGDCHEESGLQSENEAGGANRNLFDSVGACDLSYDRPTKDEITIKDEIVCDEADYAMDNLDFSLSKKIKCENLDESKPVVNTNCSESVANQSAPSEAISVSSQTSCVDTRCSSTQTDVALSNYIQLQDFDRVNSLEGAVDAMLKIDNEVMRLTELRRSIFIKLQTKKKKQNTDKSRSPKKSATSPKKSAASPKKSATSSKNRNANVESMIAEQDKTTEKSKSGETATRSEPSFRYERALEFGPISEKILVIKTIDNTMLAASESGNIFFINARDGAITATLHVSDCPITALSTWTTPKTKKLHLLVGSFETQMREYLYDNLTLLRMINLGEFVQCLEPAWSCVFIGTKNGSLMRYSLRQSKIEFEDRISRDSVLVLKAAQEGARRVLIVGTRNAPVCVRDAMSGLHLRTMNEIVSPTVYTLLLENSMVYCGTTFHDILVFRFHDGSLIHKHQATNCKGICCMKIVKNLLFASCHNGSIYVYNIKNHTYVGTIEGPGGVILSMEILENIVIVGTMSFNFKSVLIPEYILKNNEI